MNNLPINKYFHYQIVAYSIVDFIFGNNFWCIDQIFIWTKFTSQLSKIIYTWIRFT